MSKSPPIDISHIKTQMRKGVLEFCILLIISNEKVYANDILQELQKADLIVVEGTIYPLLNRLKNDGLLTYDWSESKNGPPRKYYSITSSGRLFLEKLISSWKSLDASINTLLKKFQ